MTVQVWVGEIPEHSQEREAIVALARGLARLEELYLILANFTVGGQAVDLAIFKNNGGFVIELKQCDGRVIGGVNGKWRVIDANGEVHIVNPDRRNPYNQVISYFYRLSNFLNQHRRDFLSEHRAETVDFRTCKRLVVIAPYVHPESEIVLDWKVDMKGLDELPTYLVTAISSEIQLTEDELLAIPGVLRCEPWNDVNFLVSEEGLEEWVSTVEETASVAGEAVPAAAEEAAAVTEVAERARPLWVRWPLWLVAAGTLLVLLVAVGFGTGVLPAFWVQQPVTPTPSPTATLIPLPPTPARPQPTATPMVEQVGQPFEQESAYAGGRVEVNLRAVEFQSDAITVRWAMANYGTRSVRFPLTADNIRIMDNVRNEYQVDEALSQPQAVLVARPGERVEGTCTVPRPVSTDAITIIVWVNGEPFEGDPVPWPLNIPGRE